MAKSFADIFETNKFTVSLPTELDEAFHSLPGVGIQSACQYGENTGGEWGCPSLQVLLPRNVSKEKVQQTFKDSDVLYWYGVTTVGRYLLIFYQRGDETESLSWWTTILSGLRKLALPEYKKIGPFDVYYLYVTDQQQEDSESFGYRVIDRDSQIGIYLLFQVVGSVLLNLDFKCVNLHGFRKDIQAWGSDIRQSESLAYEKYERLGFDQVVDMIMQSTEAVEGFIWSREEVRVGLMKALHRCSQFQG